MKRLLITIFTITVLLTISFATLSASSANATESVKFRITNRWGVLNNSWGETRMVSIDGLSRLTRDVTVRVRITKDDGTYTAWQEKREPEHKRGIVVTPDVWVRAYSDTGARRTTNYRGIVNDGFQEVSLFGYKSTTGTSWHTVSN